jgi:hypothetical protein
MQRDYLEGIRKKHQKPFSFFFLTATITGVTLYYINVLLQKFYGEGNMTEGAFFQQYMIFLLVFSIPFVTLLTRLFFYRSGFNFAEIGVLVLYTMSIVFLMVIFSNATKFIFPTFQTRYIEFPLITGYLLITNFNFFHKEENWKIMLKTVLISIIFFRTVTFIQDWIVGNYLDS